MSSQAKSCTFFTEDLISGKMIVPVKRHSLLQAQNDPWIAKIRVFFVPFYPKTPEKVQDFALKTIFAGYGTIGAADVVDSALCFMGSLPALGGTIVY